MTTNAAAATMRPDLRGDSGPDGAAEASEVVADAAVSGAAAGAARAGAAAAGGGTKGAGAGRAALGGGVEVGGAAGGLAGVVSVASANTALSITPQCTQNFALG